MRHIAGLTLVEVMILAVILIVFISILLPALSAARRARNGYGPSLRGIHTSLVLHAQGNNGHYVGVKSDGATIDPAVGLTTQGRVQKLIDDKFLTLDYARNPSEVQTGTTSYAMLKIDVNDDHKTIAKSIRNSEWNDTSNGQAVVLSDRAVPNGNSYEAIKSIHTNPEPGVTDWRGSVGWNDNHVTFESTSFLTTIYGSTSGPDSPGAASHSSDHLFASDAPLNNGDDALMVWTGTDSL